MYDTDGVAQLSEAVTVAGAGTAQAATVVFAGTPTNEAGASSIMVITCKQVAVPPAVVADQVRLMVRQLPIPLTVTSV